MIHAYSDYETRSVVDVGDVGSWKYAEHPSTFPLMFAVLVGDTCHQWLHHRDGEQAPLWLVDLVNNPKVVFHAL